MVSTDHRRTNDSRVLERFDQSFEFSAQIDAILDSPKVRQDLASPPPGENDDA